MGNQTEYFERIAYQPEYVIGDRVFGHYHVFLLQALWAMTP
jgi:hypothetical protein